MLIYHATLRRGEVPRTRATLRLGEGPRRAALRCVETTRRHIFLTGRATLRRRVEASLDICSWHRSRCTVATADGTRHPQLQPALSSAEQVILAYAA